MGHVGLYIFPTRHFQDFMLSYFVISERKKGGRNKDWINTEYVMEKENKCTTGVPLYQQTNALPLSHIPDMPSCSRNEWEKKKKGKIFDQHWIHHVKKKPRGHPRPLHLRVIALRLSYISNTLWLPLHLRVIYYQRVIKRIRKIWLTEYIMEKRKHPGLNRETLEDEWSTTYLYLPDHILKLSCSFNLPTCVCVCVCERERERIWPHWIYHGNKETRGHLRPLHQ